MLYYTAVNTTLVYSTSDLPILQPLEVQGERKHPGQCDVNTPQTGYTLKSVNAGNKGTAFLFIPVI